MRRGGAKGERGEGETQLFLRPGQREGEGGGGEATHGQGD